MIKNLSLFILSGITVLLLLGACNDPISIDTGLLDQDQIDLQYKEDIRLEAASIREDSVLTYSLNGDLPRFPFGNYEDPVFGKTSAELFAQLRIPIPINFENASLDSVVLSLAYDQVQSSYGIIDQSFELEVYRLLSDMDSSIYYSNSIFDTDETMMLGTHTFTPNTTDSVEINLLTADSIYTRLVPPHIRIPLEDFIGQELLDLDSISYSSNLDFAQAFKGVNIRPVSDNEGMIAFNLLSEFSRMTVYYSDVDNTPLEYNYYFSQLGAKTVNYTHDYSGAIAESFIDDTTQGDSLLFTQSMSGLNAKVRIPDVTDLGNILINKAELEFYMADLIESDTMNYEPTLQYVVAEENAEGNIEFIEDVNNAIFRADLSTFGGTLEEDSNVGMSKYTVNITTHLQDMIDGTADNFIIIRSFPKESVMYRSIFYGPGHSTFPMKLKITYTQL